MFFTLMRSSFSMSRLQSLGFCDWCRRYQKPQRDKGNIPVSGEYLKELRTKARRLKVEQGVDLIVIDYLQLIHGKSGGHRDNQ